MFQFKSRALASCAAALLMGASTAATAGSDTRDVVRNEAGKVVVNSFDNCVRTRWDAGTDTCGSTKQEEAKLSPARRLQREERTVYFEFNKSTLTPAAKQKLDSLSAVLKSDGEVRRANIVGYADPIGTHAYNAALSKRRALAVQNYLTSRGYMNTSMANTRWLGEDSPKADCPAKMARKERIACLQPDRRVEVSIGGN